ncbi:mitochondrial import inner membrane translocase subunit TIM23-2 [Ziziphus jujuba]|uniref:Mitochondrial import inner membrane translocase subunit TIM23-2 n=2 Tax=Ziziphus jujuba TaxID=326968 RepID=A0A6P4A5H7_ZIZJJ|nr:mitochondrial import inner membrane translocase subunit TIM23-2 [Ziziphus jujuba]KAH7547138.1 hypothetical protein FEM48_Zijuj01G0277600 [Ziziphus jujuba var. spinosa]
MAHPTSSSDHERGSDPNTRLYDPYRDLQVPSRYLYQLPTSHEFVFVEEAKRQRRSWGDNITFYTGTSCLGGAVAGGASGFVTGVKSFEPGDTTKLRITRILNASGHTGRAWANRLGVIGLMYAAVEGGVNAVRDSDDVWNSVAAGLATGALYRAARGVRSAAVAGALGGALVGVAVTAKQVLKRYVPI